MAKPSIDDEIDLIELIQIFWQHRFKFIVMGLLGLCLGLSFSFHHKPEFTTDFRFTLTHPIINDMLLIESGFFQKKLNDSSLNPGILPAYTMDKKTKKFTLRSDTNEVYTVIESMLLEILTQEIMQYKLIAGKAQDNANMQIRYINKNNDNLINFTNADIANISVQDVISGLMVSISKTKAVYPNPLKHGLVGIFIGLIIGFMWMVLAILISKMNVANTKHKT
jgi:LPS O-antigen subunit length determinant protein (WzzB/FepE family)